MVSLETGGVIGIDFGHAFGSATQVSSPCCSRRVWPCDPSGNGLSLSLKLTFLQKGKIAALFQPYPQVVEGVMIS